MNIQQPDIRKRHRILQLPTGQAEIWLEEAGYQTKMTTTHPSGGGTGFWKRCDVDGCLGEAVVQGTKCLRHADETAVISYLTNLPRLGERAIVSLKGVLVSQELLNTIISSPVFRNTELHIPLDFTGADIGARLMLDNVSVGTIMLYGATVRENFLFNHCDFTGQLLADYAFFNAGPPGFTYVNFHNSAHFSYAHTDKVSLVFNDCSFDHEFVADGMTGSLSLERCHFKRDLLIRDAMMEGLLLTDSSIEGTLELGNTHCVVLRAPNIKTLNTHMIGPIISDNDISLNNAQFSSNVIMKIQSKTLDVTGAQFLNGGQIFTDTSRIILNQVVTGGPLFISGTSIDKKPVITSLQGADAGRMIFSNVDMSCCIFYGTRDLDKVILEPTVKFASSPIGWDTRRRCIADEFAWRVKSKHLLAKVWKNSWERIVKQLRGENNSEDSFLLPQLQATQVAIVYRDLRHSFEAKKDLMNAADFYYGEMEMRRHNQYAQFPERLIITLYWIISGYGLYATRALLCLLITILLGAVTLFQFGFTKQPSLMESLIYSFRSAIPGLQPSGNLTISGEWIEIFLSIAGPVLAALAALAIRERVKR